MAASKKIKRVCLLNPQGHVTYPPALGKTDTGGQTLYVLELAQALAKQGIKVDIVTRQFGNQKAEQTIVEGITIVRIPCGGSEFIQKEKLYEVIPELVRNLRKYLAKHRRTYDIIHSHYWDGGYAGIRLARRSGIPHVHTPHSLGRPKEVEMSLEDLPPQKLRPALRYQVRNATEQKIMDEVNAVVIISETSRIQLLKYYQVDFEKLHVIYPGINTDRFRPKPQRVDSDIHLDKNAVLTMSRMVPAKGLDRVLEAVAQLRGKLKFNLYMGGSAHDAFQSEEEQQTEKVLERLIKKHRLEKSIHWIGNVPHHSSLPAYYRQSDVFVLAGRYEPFGLTTLEAMACGTVPIVSSVAGSREVIVDGLNGYIVDTHDRKALAAKISVLLRKPDLRKKMSENALMTIQSHFSWKKIVEQIIQLYEEVR